MADLSIALIIKAIDRASAPIRKITGNFKAMSVAVNRAQKAFAVGANMRQAAEGVNTFARATRNLLAAPISSFEDFEAAMSGVKAVSRGITDNEFKQLTEVAANLGATTRFTATQAAEGMKFLGMAGFSASKQILAIPAALDLATAAGTDLGRTTDILSDIMGAFNKEAEDTRDISDMLAVTITGSNTTLETLFETMKLVGPVATDMKISMQDVAAMTGIMGSAGIKGSLAGTALRAAIQRLVKPSAAAAEMLKRMRIETGDAQGNMRPLTDIIGDIATATEKMGTKQRGGILAEVFGVRALSGMSKLMQKMKGGEIKKFSDDIKNSTGATAEMARIMDDNAKGATVRLSSALDGLMNSLGKRLAPILTSLKETFTEIVSGLTIWTNEHPGLTRVIMLTVGAVAVLATILSGLLFTATAIVTAWGIMGVAIAAVKTAVLVLNGGLVASVLAIKTWAITIWTTAIATLKGWAITIWTRTIPAMIALTAKLWASVPAALAAAAPFLAVGLAIAGITLAIIQLVKHWKDLDILEGLRGIADTIGESGILSTIGQLFDPRTLLKDVGVLGGGSAIETLARGGAGAAGASGKVEVGIKVDSEGRVSVPQMSTEGAVDAFTDVGFATVGTTP